MTSRFKLLAAAALSALAIVAALTGTAEATHSPPGGTLADYKGTLLAPNAFDEITLDDGYDWFLFDAIGGQLVSITASRGDVGDLLPNIHLYSGMTTNGTALSTSGLIEVFDSSNSNLSSFTANFVPVLSGWYTAIISTWTGQQGTYDLTYRGTVASSTVPEPATLGLFGLGLVGLALRARRRQAG